jgi:serine/threonine protein kinase
MEGETLPVSVGEQVGRYIVQGEFGRRRWGRIYEAKHTILDRKVLLKFLPAGNEQHVQRVQREARILAQMRHPNIVSIYEVEAYKGQPYLVLNYVDGARMLSEILQNGRPFIPSVALRLISTLCSAVTQAHDRGLYHKDITPENIVIGYDGVPVLIAFEIAAPLSGDPLLSAGQVAGTPWYMSPEQWRNATLTAATDIWSLGVTLYELLTGKRLFDQKLPMEAAAAIRSQKPVSLDALGELVPGYVIDILAKCLQKTEAARYGSAEELRRELNAAVIQLELSNGDKVKATELIEGETLLLYSEHPETDRPSDYRQYEIRSLLGSGSFADVYHATDIFSGKDVAMKILKKEWISDGQAVARFRRESNLLSQLSHPNIVRLYNFGRYGESLFIAMELLDGRTLANRLLQQRTLEPEVAATFLIPVLLGLDAAHRAGVIHRDMKPQNIGFDGERVVILDFGIAHVENATRVTSPGTIMGSALYMSPEQARGQQLTAASDVYSVGTILYEMLTGHHPHECDNLYGLIHKLTSEPPIPITNRRSDLAPEIAELVITMHQPEPAFRPSARRAAESLSEATRVPGPGY